MSRRRAWGLPWLAAAAALGILPAVLVLADAAALPAQAADALASPALWQRLARSVGLSVASAAASLPVGLAVAWILVRTAVPGRTTLLALCAVPLFLPPLVHVLTWFGALGLRGVPAVVLVQGLGTAPLVALLAALALTQVARSHVETLLVAGGPVRVLADDLRAALPAGLAACVLTTALQFSDFAVADFLSAVGPKVTVYADSLYALHAAGRTGGLAAAAVPGTVILLAAVLACAPLLRRLGAGVGARFEEAPPLDAGALRLPLAAFATAFVAAGTVVPVVVLCLRTGSFATFAEQARALDHAIVRTVAIGALTATLSAALAFPLAWWAAESRRPALVDAAVLAPMAVPALLFGTGLVRVWNREGLDRVYGSAGLVVLALAGRYLAVAYLPLRAGIERLSPGLLEASAVAGAGRLRRGADTVLPLVATALVGAWCASFCFGMRELDALVVLRSAHDTLSCALYRHVVFARESELAAQALLLVGVVAAPLAAVALLLRLRLRAR